MKKNLLLLFLILTYKFSFGQNAENEPYTYFSKEYIEKYNNKSVVEIPEVSELVNIIMALHKDAENEDNMFDVSTEYYQRVKEYFKESITHPMIDSVHNNINTITLLEEHNINVFSSESYNFYYDLKMNACSYYFDENGIITHNGAVKNFRGGDNLVNKYLNLIQDFSDKSNFRQFYKDNKTYYDSLISTYLRLNPIQKMQNWLNDKFEFSYGSYVIYFSPLVNGAHSARFFNKGDFKQAFMFVCAIEPNLKVSPIEDEIMSGRPLFTEIDHSYVNPLSDKHMEKIKHAFSNRKKWAIGEITDSYHDEYMVFNEYMTFAIYSLYLFDNYPEENLYKYLPYLENQMVESRGFINFKDFNRELLKKYKLNPNIRMSELYDYILEWATNVNKA